MLLARRTRSGEFKLSSCCTAVVETFVFSIIPRTVSMNSNARKIDYVNVQYCHCKFNGRLEKKMFIYWHRTLTKLHDRFHPFINLSVPLGEQVRLNSWAELFRFE